MKTFVSSGGLGDALIVLAKILQIENGQYWIHSTVHEEHVPGIKDIQKLAPWLVCSVEHIAKNGREAFENRCEDFADKHNTECVHLNTKIIEMDYPFLQKPLVQPIFAGNICVQMTAGRNDATKRHVHKNVVQEVLALKNKPSVVLIGPDRIDFPENPRINNLTNKTKSILETFAYIGACEFFIGQDGVCSYYAAFLSIPCIINYHMMTLVNHYWNEQWTHVTNFYNEQVLRGTGIEHEQ